MKKILILGLIVFLTLSMGQEVKSQDFSENARKRLEEIESKTATAAARTATASAEQEVTSNISFLEGTVAAINGTAFLLNTRLGSRIIYTVDSTKYFHIDTSGKKLLGFSDIKVSNTIMVLGLSPQTNSGTAKIVVRDTVKALPTFSILGDIVDNKGTSLTVGNISRRDLPPLTLVLNSDTKIQAGEKSLPSTALKKGDRIVAAGTVDDKGNLVTKTILITTSPSKEATTSAQ
jgi:hypothetical protein